jgi:cytosine/adenosine deaminase-related metal-dependent hydrolase
MALPAAFPRDARLATVVLAPRRTLLADGTIAAGIGLAIGADGRFADVGPLVAVQARHPTRPMVALPGHLAMPGFVDAHHHLTQSFGKALAFGEPSEIFRRVWVPLEGALDDEALHVAAKLAALESLRGGFTTVADAGTRSEGALDAVASAVREAGLRCVLGRICNDHGLDAGGTRAVLAAGERHLAGRSAGDLVHPSLAISVPEMATDATLARTAALSAEAGAVFQTHVNEHLVAVERSLVARGLRPLEHLAQAGALGPATLCAHVTLATPSELVLLRDSGAAVAYNPVASAWKGNAVAAAHLMATLGIRLGLGTDGTRSDGFRLADAAEFAQRTTHALAVGDSSAGGGATWLAMATAGGADVLGLRGVTGAIAPGLAADLLLVDLDVPELVPSWDLAWELVRLGNRSQIDAVIVQGGVRLVEGWPVAWDARALLDQAGQLAARAVAAAPIDRIHPRSTAARAVASARGDDTP